MIDKIKTGFNKLNKAAFVLALCHFVLSIFTDRFFFQYHFFDFTDLLMSAKSIEAIFVKFIFGIVLIMFWQGIFYFFIKASGKFKRRALLYFVVQLLLLLLTWPGIWRMDEFGLLSSSSFLYPHFWQNYLTSVWYILSLMILPFPAGVIIVMNAGNALVFARVLAIFESNIKKHLLFERNLIIIPAIPFFFLPVLDSNLYPMRMSQYAFLEILFFAELTDLALNHSEHEWKLGGENRKEPKRWFLLSLLAAVLTVWRSESIYYILIYPIILLLILQKKKAGKQILLYIIMLVILFVPQKIGEKMTSQDQYELTSIVLPLVPLVIEADADSAANEELLSQINLVVNTDVLLDAASRGKNGISMFWSEPNFQRQYGSTEFATFKSAYYKLVLKYPMVFIRERFQTFLESNDLLENTTALFTDDETANFVTFRTYPLSKPVSDNLRTSVIKILELRRSEDYMSKQPFTDFVYSACISVLVLIVSCIWLLIKKRYVLFVLLLSMLAKAGLVFLTAPSKLFMYYYPVYLSGYIVLFIGIALLIISLLKKENNQSK